MMENIFGNEEDLSKECNGVEPGNTIGNTTLNQLVEHDMATSLPKSFPVFQKKEEQKRNTKDCSVPTNRLPPLPPGEVWRYLPSGMVVRTPARFKIYRVRIGDKKITLRCNKKRELTYIGPLRSVQCGVSSNS